LATLHTCCLRHTRHARPWLKRQLGLWHAPTLYLRIRLRIILRILSIFVRFQSCKVLIWSRPYPSSKLVVTVAADGKNICIRRSNLHRIKNISLMVLGLLVVAVPVLARDKYETIDAPGLRYGHSNGAKHRDHPEYLRAFNASRRAASRASICQGAEPRTRQCPTEDESSRPPLDHGYTWL
jgi:hypothetical protein